MTNWLHSQRLDAAREAVRAGNTTTVLDLGCGDGDLLVTLASEPGIKRILGVDLSEEAIGRLRRRLGELEPIHSSKVDIMRRSIDEPDPAMSGFDCAVLIEVIEHIDPERLSVVERSVFRRLRPQRIIVTTPNAEYNPLLGVPAHRYRHPDHRFEWSRHRFRRWASGVAARCGYAVVCSDIAGQHPELGGASQMAVFDDCDSSSVR